MTRFDKRYCDACMVSHWLETTNRHREECHGPDYLPTNTATHYTRWNAGGIEVIEKCNHRVNTDWLLLEEIKPADWLDLGI